MSFSSMHVSVRPPGRWEVCEVAAGTPEVRRVPTASIPPRFSLWRTDSTEGHRRPGFSPSPANRSRTQTGFQHASCARYRNCCGRWRHWPSKRNRSLRHGRFSKMHDSDVVLSATKDPTLEATVSRPRILCVHPSWVPNPRSRQNAHRTLTQTGNKPPGATQLSPRRQPHKP